MGSLNSAKENLLLLSSSSNSNLLSMGGQDVPVKDLPVEQSTPAKASAECVEAADDVVMSVSSGADPLSSSKSIMSIQREKSIDSFGSNSTTAPRDVDTSFADFLAGASQVDAAPSSAPLKAIEAFMAKTMPKKQVVRRNIRTVKSLKDLNPETRLAMEEEERRIKELETELGHVEVSVDSELTSSDTSDIEILCVEDNARSVRPSPPSTSLVVADDDVVCVPSTSSDIIFVSSQGKYPSISSFHCDDVDNIPDENGTILINTGRMKREPLVNVADHLAPHLRPHQIGGIRFMYATLVESVGKFVNSPGNGGVLAHSMGLGKTLQVIGFLDAILRHTPVKTVLIVAPLNTMHHWIAEFAKWMPADVRHEKMKVTCIRDQKTAVRNGMIKTWAEEGGVLLLGYEKLRAIVDGKCKGGGVRIKKKRKADEMEAPDLPGQPSSSTDKSLADSAEKTEDADGAEASHLIVTAGEIVICDEGHRIKSVDAAVTKVLKKVKSRRRLILTGYPLQNNLMEYWCMIDFVRPFLLGTEAEFTNLFKNPIENGQCGDSSDSDRRLMRQRTYILQKALSRIVQRRDSRPLIQELPSKREFALVFRQTPSQAQLYRSLIDELTKHRDSLNAIALYTVFRNITQHPAIFFRQLKKMVASANALEEKGGAPGESTGPIRQLLINLVKEGKWHRFMSNLDNFKFDEIHSGKMLFLKQLVKDAVVKDGEKIVIFTQSIDVLDYLQEYLPTLLPNSEDGDEDNKYPWYFRIDGSVSTFERERLINLFNDESHKTQLFLISTEAGGIGINLTGACRVVLMDVSWNPSKDIQAISRIFRYGQSRVSTIYRLVGDGSMEKCVFDRQIHKQCLFKRVVDDKSPLLAISQADLGSLFNVDSAKGPSEWHTICEEVFPPTAMEDNVLRALSGDRVFRQYLSRAPVVMDSILEADDTTKLSEAERLDAERSFEHQRRGKNNMPNQRLLHGQPNFASISSAHVVQIAARQSAPRSMQITLESVIRDPQIRQAILTKARLREDFFEEMKTVAKKEGVQLVRHDNEVTRSRHYILQSPGLPYHFMVRSDGSAWRLTQETPSTSHLLQTSGRFPSLQSFRPSPLIPPRLPLTIHRPSPSLAANGENNGLALSSFGN